MSVQIMRNILSNWGSFALGAIIQFAMTPFLITRLGDTQYGIWILIMSFTGFLGLFDFGVSGSVVKYVAELKAKKDDEELNRVCSTAFYVFLGMGTVAFLISLVLAATFVQKFKIPFEDLPMARWVTVIIGLQIGLSLPSGFFTGYMRGMQRYDHVAGVALSIFLIRTVFTVVAILMGYRLITLAVLHLMATIAAGSYRVHYVFKDNPRLRLNPRMINRETLTMVSRYSFLLFIYYMANRAIFSIGNLAIGYYLTAAMITLYAIPHRLVDELRVIIFSTGVFQPAVSHLNAQGHNDRVQRVLVNGTKYSMMAVLPIAVSYFIVGDTFIALWIGQKYAAAGHTILIILTI
ncbi:MAG: lipopolysaccharide biosynthesis protein, partial [Syntrophorhabdaceae bacterium]